MSTTALAQICFWFRDTHAAVLELVEDLSPEQLTWQPTPTANSIAFYLWHLARWADYVCTTLPGTTVELEQRLGTVRQIWHAEGLAAEWGLDPARLGEEQAGWEMDPVEAGRLRLPDKAVLVDYARRAFAAMDGALESLTDDDFQALRQQSWAADQTVGHFLMGHFVHEREHLGMMQYLEGLNAG